ncbi:hypothetical protein [Altericista sp. CCNU0014]|uniref:hypothetical protein n=1 Tax=Altericista sp. CCNU0014 TaxID=3082949 RepID=UPI00384EDD30
MTIPSKILDFLHRGWEVAAELPVKDPEQRAYIMVIPQVPNWHKNPELWVKKSQDVQAGKPILSTSDLIQGYEVRYLQHQAKYTDTAWGWDYDLVLEDPSTRVRRVFIQTEEELESELIEYLVLEDPSTRVRRVFIQTEEELESELIEWLGDLAMFAMIEVSEHFDSSLVGSPITSMLDNQEYPHLWEAIDTT